MTTLPQKTPHYRRDQLQAIKDFYESNMTIPLTDAEEETRQRFKKMWSLRMGNDDTFYTKTQILKIYSDDTGISLDTAEQDWIDCDKIFGNIVHLDPIAETNILFEEVKYLLQDARAAGDLKAAAQFTKQKADILANLRTDPDRPDFEKLKPTVTPLILDGFTQKLFDLAAQRMNDPTFYKAFTKLLGIGDIESLDFEAFMSNFTQDAESVEILE